MSWFTNETEVERQGAIELLSACRGFPFAQMALQQLRNGASPKTAGYELASFFKGQAEQFHHLEQMLSSCQWEKSQQADVIARYRRDLSPNYERIQNLEKELEAQTRQTETEKAAVEQLRSQAERERRWHEQEVRALKQQVVELNRVVASQHKKLEELTGPENPPA